MLSWYPPGGSTRPSTRPRTCLAPTTTATRSGTWRPTRRCTRTLTRTLPPRPPHPGQRMSGSSWLSGPFTRSLTVSYCWWYCWFENIWNNFQQIFLVGSLFQFHDVALWQAPTSNWGWHRSQHCVLCLASHLLLGSEAGWGRNMLELEDRGLATGMQTPAAN